MQASGMAQCCAPTICPSGVGKNTNIQDLVLCHGDGDAPVVIGDNCTIGHCAIVHGCVIEDHSLIGMGQRC